MKIKSTRRAAESTSPTRTDEPEKPTVEPVLLIHGTFANKRGDPVDWWRPGSAYCADLDDLLGRQGSAARCWAHLGAGTTSGTTGSGGSIPFAWTGLNSEAARRAAGRALAARLESLESDTSISRYHLVAHSHGGNVVLNALGVLPRAPRKLGAVVFMGTPVLSFHHRDEIDPLWIALPLYAAGLVAAVWMFPDSLVWSLVLGLSIAAAFGMDLLLRLRTRTGDWRPSVYGSGKPSAFEFAGDEAVIALKKAAQIIKDPKTFIAQFTRVDPAPPPAVEPTSPPKVSLRERLYESGAHRLIELLRPYSSSFDRSFSGTRNGVQGTSVLDVLRSVGKWSAAYLMLDLVIVLLWVLAVLPLLLKDVAYAGYRHACRWVSKAGKAVGLRLARNIGSRALPALVRQAAFGADEGRFMGVLDLPPELKRQETITESLKNEVNQIGLGLGQSIGRAMFEALAATDTFAIRTLVTDSLTDQEMVHSQYYQAGEVPKLISELIAASPPSSSPTSAAVPFPLFSRPR